MTLPGRNDPCPCGSSRKFKKCCIDRDAAELARMFARSEEQRLRAEQDANRASIAALEDEVAGLRHEIEVVKNFAQPSMLTSHAKARVREILAGSGVTIPTAEDLLEFAAPLMEKAEDDAALSAAVHKGVLLWSAVTRRNLAERVSALEAIEQELKIEGERQIIEFRILADRLRKRHKFLFPHVWRALHEPAEPP